MFAQVLLLSPPYSVLTYSLPAAFPQSFWRQYQRVAVPLGKKASSFRAGVIISLQETASLPPGTKCRDICWPLEAEPLLNKYLLDLAEDLATRQCSSAGFILGHVLPAGLRSARVRISQARAEGKREFGLEQISRLNSCEYGRLADDLLKGNARFAPNKQLAADTEICVLNVDPPWPLRPAAIRQKDILEYLYANGATSRRRLAQIADFSTTALQTLIKNGLVAIKFTEEENEQQFPVPVSLPFELNREQKNALDDIIQALEMGKSTCRLLYGVTGSGKTAVYLQTIKACMASGKNAILLAPEVALAGKLYREARAFLPEIPVFFYHGYQQPATREKIYRMLAATRPPALVVGTRSALFLPINNPGCIILDEEHDDSFKQDENFAYHAKEVAWFRAAQANALLILGSATPDIKTFHAASMGNLPILHLKKRVENRKLPPVELVGMTGKSGSALGSLASMAQGESLLAKESEEALYDCMKRGEQAVIFLNRRGYSPMIYCVDCGKVLHCPHCEIGLAFHKNLQKLVCHYCGYSIPYPSPCKGCGKMNFLAIGEGTERLSERLEAMTGQPVLRLDRDSTRRQGSVDEILNAFGNGQSPFLVGTQMLSKGHHFPNVTLVVAADGDIGLNLPDYRAAERTFQLLLQAAGRAGRGKKPGRVLVQTRDTSHYCWNYLPGYDYESFCNEELNRRKRGNYPPFVKLALLRISYPFNCVDGNSALRDLAKRLKSWARELGVILLGPAPSPIAMLRGRRRFQCLLKSSQWPPIRQLYHFSLQAPEASVLRLFLDIDPVNML